MQHTAGVQRGRVPQFDEGPNDGFETRRGKSERGRCIVNAYIEELVVRIAVQKRRIAQFYAGLHELAEDAQEIDPLAADIDSDRKVEPAIGAFLDTGVPEFGVGEVDDLMAKTGVDLDVPAGSAQLRDCRVRENRPSSFVG